MRSLTQSGGLTTPPESGTYVPQTPVGRDIVQAASATPLLPWTAAAANRDNARATCLLIGDSITEGSKITALNNVWGHRMSGLLRQILPLANGQTRGGHDMLMANQATVVAFTAPVTFTGTGSAPAATGMWGLAHRGAVLSPTSQSVTITLPAPATSIDIEWVAGNGTGDTMSVAVDGGTATTYSGLAQNTAAYQRITFSARGTHTIVISCTVGTVVFNGARVYDGDESTGIHVAIAGLSGSLTSNWVAPGDSVTTNARNQSYSLLAPDLVVIELGVNDFFNAIPLATYKANMNELIADIKGVVSKASFVILAPPPPYLAGATIPWSSYVQTMRDIAASRTDTIAVDLGRRVYGANTGDPQALFADTIAHPNDKGSALVAQLVGKAITDGMLTGPAIYTQANTWTAPTLQNGWAVYGAGFTAPGYRKDANGVVELQGMTNAGTATAGTTMFQLPIGYRPAATKPFACASADAFGEVRVGADGTVKIYAGANTWFSLEGIRFLAEG